MRSILLVSFLIIIASASEAASKIDSGTPVVEDTSATIERIDGKNLEVITQTKSIQVKISNFESIQQKLNEQNSK